MSDRGTSEQPMAKVMSLEQALKFFLFSILAVDAHLVSPTSYLPSLPVAVGVWILGVGLTWLYYRASL